MEHKNPIHIYRSLLRAISYFPDAFARTYFRSYFKDQFASHRAPGLKHILKRRLTAAQKGARCLDRAGRGSIKDFTKSLEFAHGRRGLRRRQLVEDLLPPVTPGLPRHEVVLAKLKPEGPGVPEDDVALAKFIAEYQPGDEPSMSAELKEAAAKFQTFLRSHIKDYPRAMGFPKVRVRTMEPVVPATNTWGRPMPLRRQRSIRIKWFAQILDEMYPAVPLDEWNRLRDLALGVLPVEKPLPRRVQIRPTLDPEEVVLQHNKRVLKYLMQSTRDPGSIYYDPDHGLVVEEERAAGGKPQDHTGLYNSQRTMRRVYGSIWRLTSTIYRDETTNKWTVKWGNPGSLFHSGVFPSLSKDEAALFCGLKDLPLEKGLP